MAERMQTSPDRASAERKGASSVEAEPRRARGFAPAAGHAAGALRRAAGRRGIAESRLLTHWPEVVGPALAARSRPLRIRHDRGGTALGGVLILAVDRAAASEVEHEKGRIVERVNAHYGYAAIGDVRLTQAAQPLDDPERIRQKPIKPDQLDAPARARLDAVTRPIDDPELRAALTRLGANVIGRSKSCDASDISG